MESTDPIGKIQLTEDVYERLRHAFVLEERGEVDVKGKGVMRTWFLLDRKPASGPPTEPVDQDADLAAQEVESRTG